MQEKFDEWLNQVNGKPIEVEDSSALNQCMDLAFNWCDFIGIPHSVIAHPYAYQVWANPTDAEISKFDFIPNTPNGIPQVGDLVVFNQGVGSAGHISIATGEGNVNSFVSEDQNWNGHKYAEKITHTYTDVYGFLRFKQTDTPPVSSGEATAQTKLDLSDINDVVNPEKIGILEFQALKGRITAWGQAYNLVVNANVAMQNKDKEYLKTIGDDATKIGSLQSELDAIKNQPGTTTAVIHESFTDWLKSLFSKKSA